MRWGIVQAGRTAVACSCVEKIQSRVDSERPIALTVLKTIIEECAQAERRHAVGVHGDYLQAGLESKFNLIVGVFEAGKPHLFELSTSDCRLVNAKNQSCIGTADQLARYILDGIDLTGVPIQQAENAAAYAAHMAAMKDKHSEGPLVIACLTADDAWGFETPDWIDEMTTACREFEAERQKQWSRELLNHSLKRLREQEPRQ